MATTYTLTGQVTDALDSSPEALTRLSGYAEASQPLINDTGTNTQRVGRVPLSFDSDGNFTVALVGTGSLVAGWRVVLNWRDSTFRSQEQTYSTGYFTMTANKTFAAAIVDGGSGSVIPITPTLDVAVAALVSTGSGATSAALGSSYVALAGDVMAPVPTGIAATDTAAAQAAIDACPEGGTVTFPGSPLGVGLPYRLNASLVINKHIRVLGRAVGANTVQSALPDNPGASPWVYGTVFEQTLAGADAFTINGANKRVDLSNLAVTFASAIRFTNTGHGFNATGPVVVGHSYHYAGVTSAEWSNLVVFGHDGNHYAYKFTNSMHVTTRNLRSHGGGVMHVLADNSTVNWGNMLNLHPFGSMFCAGTADGYRMETTTVSGGGDGGSFGLLNFVTTIRGQCNISGGFESQGATNPTVSQAIWRDVEATTGRLRDNLVIAPDLEADLAGVASKAVFLDGSVVIAGGGTLPPSTWYRDSKRYNQANAPTVTAINSSQVGGSGSSVAVNGAPPSTDQFGSIIINTGTTTPTFGSDIIGVTFGTPFPSVPVMQFWLIGTSPGRQFGASATVTSGKTVGFLLRSDSALAANTQYQIGYRIQIP